MTATIVISILAILGIAFIGHASHCYHRDKMFKNGSVGKHCKYYLGAEKRDGIVLHMDKEFTTVRDTYSREEHMIPTSQIYAPWL